ncbi:hexamethylene bisacetamide inducible [Anticarsia gemmatalis]|uniref:hexamethylene bisacetamide inducible n=1 Tax=Anticarsia gemmatalis TaxID=129554 RepID=UPI003F7706B1
MDENNIIVFKDGDQTRPAEVETPSAVDLPNQKFEGSVRKKRRRGKSKRKIMKPFTKIPWQDRRKNDKTKRNNRFRKIVLAKTHAPFNNNQFLMEIHKPEPENTFHILRTPSARTRDSSFSVDSEENYFYSLPEDEEEYLTKEFSSVYEDAQSERLSNMSKDDLIQEYLLLEAKYDNLIKRTERSKVKCLEDDKDLTVTDRDTSITDRESMITDRDTSGTSVGSSTVEENSFSDLLQRMKDQEDQIRTLQMDNEKLRLENEHLRQRSHDSSSADSESDSSSTSDSDSSSNRSVSPIIRVEPIIEEHNHVPIENHIHENGQNEETEGSQNNYPLVNGCHDSNE